MAAWRLGAAAGASHDVSMPASAAKVDCPAAPPSRQSTPARSLHRACLILGGVGPLADHLGVTEAALTGWLGGRAAPPQIALLAAVEIMLLQLDNAGSTH